ncbi:MAG: DNA polymerase/3'-5' exonuclease PolX, partial [Acidobacteria bacterium]|nr:DNA polymerase/3'-5' exonuclease PolX [Acidobacteriota bacterium]
MENRDIAAVFEQIASLMKILQDDPKWTFKAAAYERAARSLESFPERAADLALDPERKLTAIPGVGADLASKIKELAETGKCEYHQEQLNKVPPTLLDMLQLQGVGPQKVRLFYKQMGIKSVAELQAAAQAEKLRGLPGMSKKSEENILKAVDTFERAVGRFLLAQADRTAELLASFLKESKNVDTVTPAGSLRRGKETVGDLDLLVIGKSHARIAEHFTSFPEITEVLAKGEDKVSVRLKSGLQVDVRLLEPESYGAALQYFTGSKEHNVLLRDRAKRRGLRLNEYGLFKGEGKRRIAGRTEEEVYAKLGLPWIPPELRECQGEIEAAEEGRLPRLLELKDIKGDLQMHTRASDGKATVAEMARAALQRGYRYIAVTDHSKSVTIANGLDEKRALEYLQEVRAARKKVPEIEIWAGMEVDIMGDGSMDMPDDILRQLDVVVATIHSRMNMPAEEMTARILKALENPYVKILGHPTGRQLLRRDPYQYDMDLVFETAKKKGVVVEINASPERLDLCDRHVRLAKEK